MSKYSKINFVYFMQKWMDSVPGQTFLNYAYSWGAAVVILGTLFKLTHLPGANVMLFIGMGTEVFVFFISAFDRPFDKSTIDMTLDNHMSDGETQPMAIPANGAMPMAQPVGGQAFVGQPNAEVPADAEQMSDTPSQSVPTGGQSGVSGGSFVSGGPVITGGNVISGGTVVSGGQPTSTQTPVTGVPGGGTIIIGGGVAGGSSSAATETSAAEAEIVTASTNTQTDSITFEGTTEAPAAEPRIVTPAPAVSPATAEAMEAATTAYVERLEQLNETLQKVEALSSRLATDSEEMENLNRTLTGIARVYEMQLKSASQQITTQDSINEQTRIMADKIKELNTIYARMIEAMTVNMPKVG